MTSFVPAPLAVSPVPRQETVADVHVPVVEAPPHCEVHTVEPAPSQILSNKWARMQAELGRDGMIHLCPDGSRPLWIVQADQARAYRSLTMESRLLSGDGQMKAVSTVVDSGAAATLISEATWRSSAWSKRTLTISNQRLCTASGENLNVLGLASIELVLGGKSVPLYALVVQDLAASILLGVDFLAQVQAVIDFPNNVLKIPGLRDIALSCTAPNLAKTVHSVTIPPRSHAMIPVRVDAPAGSTVIIQNASVNKWLSIPRSVDSVRDGRTYVSVVNTSPHSQIIRGDRYLAEVAILDDVMAIKPPSSSSRQVPVPDPRHHHDWRAEMASGIHTVQLQDHFDDHWESTDFGRALSAQMAHLSVSQRRVLIKRIWPYRSIFVAGQTQMPTAATDHVARILGGSTPVSLNPYRTALWKRKLIDEQVQDLLNQDLIEPSLSPWSAPVVLVEKPGQRGKWRLCIDYRKLNEAVDTVIWPLPRMDDCITQVQSASWFTCLDLAWGLLRRLMIG